jgi:hypothetical protein
MCLERRMCLASENKFSEISLVGKFYRGRLVMLHTNY